MLNIKESTAIKWPKEMILGDMPFFLDHSLAWSIIQNRPYKCKTENPEYLDLHLWKLSKGPMWRGVNVNIKRYSLEYMECMLASFVIQHILQCKKHGKIAVVSVS